MSATYHDLKNKSVFITGGGSGIGAAVTESFLAQGAQVAFVQRSDASKFCAAMAEKYGTAPLFISCDITNVEALRGAIDQAASAHGSIDILVNNAANDDRHETESVSEEYWDKALDINLKPYFFAAQRVVTGMKNKGGGSVINFSSIAYLMGIPEYPAYVTANAGITGLTRALAREFGPEKIRVNAIAPGWTMTKKQQDLWVTPEGLAGHLERQCLKEAIQPEDIAGAVLFLASDASRMITGQLLPVDGGVVTTG